jgi:hypothetical protein
MRLAAILGVLSALVPSAAFGSVDSNGPNGINSGGLSLTGAGIDIGQVETGRPGDPNFDTNASLVNSMTNPADVYFWNQFNFNATSNAFSEITAHAVEVAGLMISADPVAKGVATDAELHSIGINPVGPTLVDIYTQTAQAANHIATLPGERIWAMNMSINVASSGDADGSSLLTSYVDWSAHNHDILYVIAGWETGGSGPVPSDNFNGLTVAMSQKNGGVYREVDTFNNFTGDDFFGINRTFPDILAPGRDIQLAAQNDVVTTVPDPIRVGTSLAAPHVTGTVALLQQHAAAQSWGANARRHELMKAVLMNSADKIKDDGTFIPPGESTPIPQGRLLGMERTVLKSDGVSTWFDSIAYNDDPLEQGSFWPLDDEMGTGHLNAGRAFTQYSPGEFDNDAADVPTIGWDYGTTTGMNDINRYQFNTDLRGGSFISITLAWDREVPLNTDGGTTGIYDPGDTFVDFKTTDGVGDPPADSQINDLTLWLVPSGLGTVQAVASSAFSEGTVEHIFFQIPTTGSYEILVQQEDDDVGNNQDYAIAWWAAAATLVSQGDFNNDGSVDGADLAQWKDDFGVDDGSDANGDGVTDGADYLVWQRNFGLTSSAPATNAVPEPSALCVALIGLLFVRKRRNAYSGGMECVY